MTPSRIGAAGQVIRCLCVGAVLLALPAYSGAQTQNSQTPVVVATGESTITVAPDQAWVMVSLETRESRGPEARRLGAAAMTSVMATLKATGLPDDTIQTTGFSLRPEYEYPNGRQRLKGFVVFNQVQVRIDDIDKVAEVLDAIGGLSLPASSTATLGNLRFDLKDRRNVERQALRQAVEDGVARATAMAEGAGRRVGETTLIEEIGSAGVPKFQEGVMMSRAGDAMVATPVSPADIVIGATVRVTLAIVGHR